MRYDYAVTLLRRHKHAQAIAELDRLLAIEPGNRAFRITYATACVGLGRLEEAIERYRALLARNAEAADLHLSVAHALKTLGRQKEAVESYGPPTRRSRIRRRLLESRQPQDLPVHGRGDRACAPRSKRADIRAVDRYHLCFALGKALEDRGEFAESFGITRPATR